MITILVPILLVALLICLNGLFVAAEFAIVSIPRAEVEQDARQGKPRAALVQWFIDDPQHQDRFIATAQLGVTAASLGLGMYGEQTLAGWISGGLAGWQMERWIAASTVASVIAVSILTYFHIVLGEMVPKSLALQFPGRVMRSIAPLMRGVQLAAYPFVVFLNGAGTGLLHLFGIHRETVGAEYYQTREEIAYVVRESQAGGMLRQESAQVISDLLEFGHHTAVEVMVPRVRVVALPVEADLETLQALLRRSPHTRYPVYRDTLDQIVGMLHVRDALRWIHAGHMGTPDDYRPVPHVPATATSDQVLAAMRQAGVQMVVVMDEHGGTAGIVTLEDLFEEVVGDITERTSEVPEIVVEANGRVRVDGAVRVEEVGDALGIVLEHAEVDTISGLVLALLGRPPVVGDAVEFDGAFFQVAAVRGKGVRSCVVWVPGSEVA
ncbi:MAG: hemolysin family protein [Gemmatimonadota bacterium]|jgi:CBS domain containing-hemolysin-like protein|nr:hemolysin family protein [Gemmatimonadota bacterium]